MIAWLKQYALHHLFYIILIVGGVVGFRLWLSEHDQRVAIENKVKANDQLVKSLQDGIASRDALLAKQNQVVVKVVHDVQTTTQAVAAVPQLVTPQQAVDLKPTVSTTDPNAVEVQAKPFIALLGDYKIVQQENATCQADLADEKKIEAADQDTIKELKKKPKFWARMKSHGKVAIIGMLALEGVRVYLTGKP
jgi:hypothetical protein